MAIKELRFPEPQQVFTTVFHRLNAANTRFLINYGGTGSSKSFSCAQKEVLVSIQKKVRTLVIRKVNATLKDSIIASFKSRIQEFDLWSIFSENKTDQTLTCTQTGSEIIFKGLDDPEKLKSIEGIGRIVIEEASELEYEDFLELNRRVRGLPNIQLTLCFNPIHEDHWLKTHFFDREFPDCTIIHSTYKDNQFLTAKDREQIEYLKEFDYNQYRVYALGDWGITDNNNPWLYSFEQEMHVKPRLPFLQTYPVYLSFDFNNDPFACVATQMSPDKGGKHSFIHILKEFSGQIKVEDMCARIRSEYPSSILYVTGDRSGQNEDVGRNQTAYQIIAGLLDLSNKQLNLNTTNLTHYDSRVLINAMFRKYPNLYISGEGCPTLIKQCISARVDDKGKEGSKLLKDRDKFKNDEFDAMRYFFQTYFNEWCKETYFKALKKK